MNSNNIPDWSDLSRVPFPGFEDIRLETSLLYADRICLKAFERKLEPHEILTKMTLVVNGKHVASILVIFNYYEIDRWGMVVVEENAQRLRKWYKENEPKTSG